MVRHKFGSALSRLDVTLHLRLWWHNLLRHFLMNHVLIWCQTIRKSRFWSLIMLVHIQNINNIVLLLDIFERRTLECFMFIPRIFLCGNFLLIYMTYFLFYLIERTMRLHHLSLFIFWNNEIWKLQTLSRCINRIIQILWESSSHGWF